MKLSSRSWTGIQLIMRFRITPWASLVALVVKNLPVNAGDKRDLGSILGSGRSLGGGHGNPLQYSCLRGAGLATVHRVTNSQTEVT